MRDKNVYELAVKKKVEGAFKWVRAAVIAGYILLTVAIIVIANITRIGAVFIVIVPMILLLIVIPATWRLFTYCHILPLTRRRFSARDRLP